MKLPRRTGRIPELPIALLGVLLGMVLASALMIAMASERPRNAAMLLILLAVLSAALMSAIGLVMHRAKLRRPNPIDRYLLEAFLEHIPDNVFFKDLDSRFMRVSKSMANYCGLSDPAQAIGLSDSDIFSAEHAGKALTDEQEIIRTGEPMSGREELESWSDGRETWVLTTKVPMRNRSGEIIGTMGISRNIADRKEAEARIHHMAMHDALTGLPNRILLQDRLSQAIGQARRYGERVAVLLLDLDRLKGINDSLGHYIGDRLLAAVAIRLGSCLRESDIVARLSADEFVICLPRMENNKGIELVAQLLLDRLSDPFEIEGRELRISCSMGICQYPIDGENPETLLQAADAAMYEAKSKGRATFCFFTSDLNEASKRKQTLESDLRRALELDEFVLHYQPLVSTDSGRVTGVEALLRWRHPQQGLIPPNLFIPSLEELGMMVEVGRWVLKTACAQNVAWQREGLAPIRVAVNVSPQQFHRGNIVGTVETVLRETGLDARWLELELTESLSLDDAESSIRKMHELKALGVGLSLDDFGTGWSSLSYLRKLPLDRIKIDRSFLRDVATQPTADTVVRGIVSLARNLNLECIGEGVETPQQLAYLQRQVCSEAQGFLFSPGLPATECGQLLRARKDGFPGVGEAGYKALHGEAPSPRGLAKVRS